MKRRFEVSKLYNFEAAQWGHDGFKGLKDEYEDRVGSWVLEGLGEVWGLFDGHGGAHAAEFVASKLATLVESRAKRLIPGFDAALDRAKADAKRCRVAAARKEGLPETWEEEAARAARLELTDDQWRSALVEAFAACDAAFLELADRKGWNDGSCALFVVLADDASSSVGKKLVVANAGDSRAVMDRKAHPLRCSTDHKPGVTAEKRRIEKAGGYVVQVGGAMRATSPAGYGFGVKAQKSLYLSVARAIGDRQLKAPTPVVTCEPQVRIFSLTDDDRRLVLACDGVTDALDDADIVRLASLDDDTELAAKAIVKDAYAKGAADNLTALVIRFPWAQQRRQNDGRGEASVDPAPAAAEPLDMFA